MYPFHLVFLYFLCKFPVVQLLDCRVVLFLSNKYLLTTHYATATHSGLRDLMVALDSMVAAPWSLQPAGTVPAYTSSLSSPSDYIYCFPSPEFPSFSFVYAYLNLTYPAELGSRILSLGQFLGLNGFVVVKGNGFGVKPGSSLNRAPPQLGGTLRPRVHSCQQCQPHRAETL